MQFWKMSGAGNDFILFNNMSRDLFEDQTERAQLVLRLCQRGMSVGADGAIFIEPSSHADFRMRYYNADGGEADTCGNGARCVARFALLQNVAKAQMQIETNAGMYQAEVFEESVRIEVGNPGEARYAIDIKIDGGPDSLVDFINTGVPHAVLRVIDVDSIPVQELGCTIRNHAEFAPEGTNVDFISKNAEGDLRIRTYERGVEAETLACGTGAIAAAIVAQRHDMVQSPVTLITQSGCPLTIHFEPTENGARNVQMQGEARLVYRGELS